MVKNPPAVQEMQERQVQSLGWEDPLEEEMVTRSSILAWKISWMEEHGRLHSMGLQRVGLCKEFAKSSTSLSFFLSIIYGLYYVEVGSFCAHFLKSFNHKWC